jgi:hypothetical protein
MAKGREDFFTRLADRAVPGAGRLIRAVDSLEQGIESLEKKVGGLEGATDKRVSQIERGIERLSRATTTDRPVKPSPHVSSSPGSDEPSEAQGPS